MNYGFAFSPNIKVKGNTQKLAPNEQYICFYDEKNTQLLLYKHETSKSKKKGKKRI